MKTTVISKFISIITALSCMMLPTGFVLADQDAGIQIGVLTCSVVPGSRVNLLIRSTADVECSYDNQGQTERYKGETGIALGLDISIKNNEKMAFAVLAASADVTPGAYALAGKYVGGQASAAAGVGLGAKVLLGGGDKNISLQPIALETSTGLGASAGIGFLYIEPAQ